MRFPQGSDGLSAPLRRDPRLAPWKNPQEIGPMRQAILLGLKAEPPRDEFQPVYLVTRDGDVAVRYYPVPNPRRAVLWVGGQAGEWDSPCRNLYPRLSRELQYLEIASLRVRFRDPFDFAGCVRDLHTGIAYLESLGIFQLALVGHCLGGGAVIQTAAEIASVRTVVTLATQAQGTDSAYQLGPRCSLLLLHGESDSVLSPYSSQYAFRLAQEPKKLVLYPQAGHALEEVAQEVYEEVKQWILEQLLPSSKEDGVLQ